ncbi:MAG: DUF2232 domain-containing protein [Limnochordia bacterium]|jgi:uncharacterized protein YybS (DUF2232 family)
MKTRSLTEGAMLGAITVLLTLIGNYLGFPPLLIPVPLIILVYRHDIRAGIFAALAAAVVAGLVGGHLFAGISIVIWGFLSVALGMGLREKFSFTKLMVVGTIATIVVLMLEFLLFSLILGENMLTEMMNMMVTSIEQAKEISQGLGLDAQALERYDQLLQTAQFLMQWALPALLLIAAVGIPFLNLGVVRMILKRLGDQAVPWVKPFTQWTLPPHFGVVLLFGLGVMLLSRFVPLPAVILGLGINTFVVIFGVYLIMGLAVVWHFFNEREIARFLRVLFIFFLFTTEIISMFVVLLGATDNVFDFRKLRELEN